MRNFLKKDRGLLALGEARLCNRREAEHMMLLQAFTPGMSVPQAESLNEHREKSELIYRHLSRFCEILSEKQDELSAEEEGIIRELLDCCRKQSRNLRELIGGVKTDNENVEMMLEHFRRELRVEEMPVGRYF